jgi:hypothetical protein
MPNWTGSWAGGRTYQTKDNRTVWVIRKMVKGHRYQIVLDCETERQALAQLALFDQDPSSYKTPSVPRVHQGPDTQVPEGYPLLPSA